MDRDLPRRQLLLGEIIVVISGRHIPGYAVEHAEDRQLQRGDPRATRRDHHGKGDIAEDRLRTRAKRVQHLYSGCAAEAAPVRRPARYWSLHGHQVQSEEVRVAGHETCEVSLRRSVPGDHCREAKVRPVDVSIAVEIGAKGGGATARDLHGMCRRCGRAVARYGGPRSEGISWSGTRGEPERRCHYCGAVQSALHGSSLALAGAAGSRPLVDACPNRSRGTPSCWRFPEAPVVLRGSSSRRNLSMQ